MDNIVKEILASCVYPKQMTNKGMYYLEGNNQLTMDTLVMMDLVKINLSKKTDN